MGDFSFDYAVYLLSPDSGSELKTPLWLRCVHQCTGAETCSNVEASQFGLLSDKAIYGKYLR